LELTKISDEGFAQPDIEATKDGRKCLVFVETLDGFRENLPAIVKTMEWLCGYTKLNVEEIRIVFVEGSDVYVLCSCGQKHRLFKGIDAPMYWCGDELKALEKGDKVECNEI